ncbi:MAG TPA: hypothetical protein PLL78_13620 [Fimbriimonadaceae bacterium]|nr:hypothetical protein [Fimbriimonadaceae bacterium]HRJ97714.1 hypothetical protein [Fimbriimonadaceae bacterium]
MLRHRTLLTGTAAGLAIALAVGSCRRNEAVENPPETVSAVRLTAETFSPDRLPYEEAALILAGTTYPVQLRRESKADGIHFLLLKGEEVLDREVYVLDEDAFRIRIAAGVEYQPPIPLIEFGKRVGDEWSWRGHVVTGAERQSAAASITTAEEDINLAGAYDRGVRIRATLEIDGAGSAQKLQKQMTFWFAPRIGLLKREFGTTSTRIPAP